MNTIIEILIIYFIYNLIITTYSIWGLKQKLNDETLNTTIIYLLFGIPLLIVGGYIMFVAWLRTLYDKKSKEK